MTMSLWVASDRMQIDRFCEIFASLSDLLMGALDARLSPRPVLPSQRAGLRAAGGYTLPVSRSPYPRSSIPLCTRTLSLS